MRETKLEKRLVREKRYARLKGTKMVLLYLGSIVLICAICVLVWIFPGYLKILNISKPDDFSPAEEIAAGMCGLIVFLSVAGIGLGGGAIIAGNAIKPEKSKTHHDPTPLPAHVSLLRGSDLPPTVAQAELLRATQAAQETPQEQLLRAAIGEE